MGDSMDKYIIARLIGARAFQIALDSPPMLKPEPHEQAVHLAKRELEEGVIPLSVRRKNTNN